ncbi:MAG: hypothetical protein LBC42_00355 [Puniceicoccales bacterium]|nr:hypothetical protein [Puniceicoccales bacterium]
MVCEHIFGTDGIRGTVGSPLICATFFQRLGRALEKLLERKNLPRRIIIGCDGRSSAATLRNALLSGLSDAVEIWDIGVLSTPAIASAVPFFDASIGISLTASHNGASDNGAKFFDCRGHKWSAECERQLERSFENITPGEAMPCHPTVHKCHKRALNNYLLSWRKYFSPKALSGLKVVLDMANGAASYYGVHLLESIGAEVVATGNAPNGNNINKNCGSEWPHHLLETVRATESDFGLALDGDGDRALLCGKDGYTIAGEHILARLSLAALRQHHVSQIVTTQQANGALDGYLAAHGIDVLRTEVGDRNVAEALEKYGCPLGGEPSGHVIFSNCTMVADGLLTGAFFLQTFAEQEAQKFPQNWRFPLHAYASTNIPVAKKFPLDEAKYLQECRNRVEEKLGLSGRVFIRYSGTENKLRMLVEATDDAQAQDLLSELSDAFFSDAANF